MILTGVNDDMEIIRYNDSPSKQVRFHTITVTQGHRFW